MGEEKKKKKKKKKKGDKDKKKNEQKVVEAEFKVSMHCNGCERSVAKAISKIKGVERFTTDMTKHKVVIIGRIKPEKVMKKLKKKTGKRVELVINKEDPKDDAKEADSELEVIPDQAINSFLYDYLGDSVVCTMFSDENANACSIMKRFLPWGNHIVPIVLLQICVEILRGVYTIKGTIRMQ